MTDMVERVARAMYDKMEGPVANQDYKRQVRQWDECVDFARAAIRIALEEAAKVADEISELESKMYTIDHDRYAQGKANGAKIIAAAIRAMIKD